MLAFQNGGNAIVHPEGSPVRSVLVESENIVYAYLMENPSEPMTV